MKIFPCMRLVVLLVACQMLASLEATAQTLFLSVQINSNTIPVNSSVTYTIGVTNLSAIVPFNIFVTNTLPASVQIISDTPPAGGTATISGSSVVFSLGPLGIGATAIMTVTAQPTAVGFFTNDVILFSPDAIIIITTNVVVQATNSSTSVTSTLGDLAVSITGPPQPVFIGDWTTYGIVLTNGGPGSVTNISLVNTLPAGAKFLSISPATPVPTLTSNKITFAFTSLTNRSFRKFNVRVQMPTNAGPALFSVAVAAPGTQDTNSVNNTASTNVLVSDYFPASLVAVISSAQITNRLNGLIEQKILVTNNGPTNVDSVRVIVSGLTNVSKAGFTNYLFNAWGTNTGNPFVVYANTLAPGGNVELLLQFYSRTVSHFPFSDSQLHPFAVNRPDLTAPAAVSKSTSLHFSRQHFLASAGMFLEVTNTIIGHTYTFVYSDNASLSNAMIAVPSIVAPANDIQWIDYGPPATVSKPTSGMRFYGVFQNP